MAEQKEFQRQQKLDFNVSRDRLEAIITEQRQRIADLEAQVMFLISIVLLC